MAGRNLIILIGNLGRDPETRDCGNDKSVCNFSLAVQERKEQPTEWFDVAAWDKLGGICQQYLKKGSQVYIEGRQKTETWEKDGEEKSKKIVVVYTMTMLGQARGEVSQSAPSNAPATGENEFAGGDIPF